MFGCHTLWEDRGRVAGFHQSHGPKNGFMPLLQAYHVYHACGGRHVAVRLVRAVRTVGRRAETSNRDLSEETWGGIRHLGGVWCHCCVLRASPLPPSPNLPLEPHSGGQTDRALYTGWLLSCPCLVPGLLLWNPGWGGQECV